jgi:hypothetical protein
VQSTCESVNIVTKFDLRRNEFGEFGVLTIFDIDSEDSIQYEMATGIPQITATNIAQQLGGSMTYTERYLKMSVFGIAENSLDFDDKDNSKKSEPKQSNDNREWLNPGTEKWKQAVKWLVDGGKLETIEKNYKISKINKELLLTESI